MIKQALKAHRRQDADLGEVNISRMEATCCIGASALATIAVLVWAARTYLSAVL